MCSADARRATKSAVATALSVVVLLLAGCGSSSVKTDSSGAKSHAAPRGSSISREREAAPPVSAPGGVALSPADAEKVLREMQERHGSTADAPIKRLLESLRASH